MQRGPSLTDVSSCPGMFHECSKQTFEFWSVLAKTA